MLLTIKGNQLEAGPGEYVELVTEGRLYREESGYVIEFDESGLTGRDRATTRIRLEDGGVTLSRDGEDETHIVFSKDSVYESSFSTPLGVMRLNILPLQIESDLSDERGSLKLEYELSTGERRSLGKLDLSFKSIGGVISPGDTDSLGYPDSTKHMCVFRGEN